MKPTYYFKVRFDDVETTLTFDSHSHARGWQYMTPGNASSHAFLFELSKGQKFRTNGRLYEVLDGPYWVGGES